MQLLLERIQRDLQLLGEDGATLDNAVKKLVAELRKLRSAGHQQLQDDLWSSWSKMLMSIKKNPLHAEIKLVEGVPQAVGESEAKTETDAVQADDKDEKSKEVETK